MLGGPSDVQQHIAVIEESLYEWNAIHSEHQKSVVLPLHWTTHARPRLGKRPQEIINNDVLAKSDVLIAVFGSRVGTPTGDDISGTVEEIRKHIATDGRALIYFSAIPVDPTTIQVEQIAALREFKTECESTGIIRTFNNAETLKTIANRDISQLMNDLSGSTELKKEPSKVSDLALELIFEAAKTNLGQIHYFTASQGDEIEAGKFRIEQQYDRKQFAMVKQALYELVELEFVNQDSKNVFSITGNGYTFVDQKSSS